MGKPERGRPLWGKIQNVSILPLGKPVEFCGNLSSAAGKMAYNGDLFFCAMFSTGEKKAHSLWKTDFLLQRCNRKMTFPQGEKNVFPFFSSQGVGARFFLTRIFHKVFQSFPSFWKTLGNQLFTSVIISVISLLSR